jgi:hypothetical protein
MASTYTPLGIELMATGENAGTWGTKTNANLNLVEQLAGGFKTLSIAGGAQTTALTVADGALTGTAQARMIEFTGSISGSQIVTIPNDVVNFYILKNATSGAQTVQFKYASGSGDTFTFATGNKGTALLFASGNPDTTNPKIIEIQTGGDVVDDTSPQLGGNLDTNDFNIAFDDAHGIIDENGNEQLIFQTTGSAVNQFDVTNAATGNAPSISATGGDTNIDVAIIPKGSGETKIGTGAAAATLTSSGAHDLTLDTNSGTNSGAISIVDGANGNITLTPNGSGKVVLDGISFPNADGSADQILTTNGSGVLSFVDNSGGTSWQAVKTSTFTAVAGEGYFVNTTSGVITMNLPAGVLGSEISFADYAGTFDSNTFTISANSSEKILGSTADLTVSVERAANTLVYTDGTQGWLLKNK